MISARTSFQASSRHIAYALTGSAEKPDASPRIAYWRDVGTIDSYYTAKHGSARSGPAAEPVSARLAHPYLSRPKPPGSHGPGPLGNEGQLANSLLAAGRLFPAVRSGIRSCSSQVQVDENAVVEDSILFDGVHVGAGAHLKRCIVDKTCRFRPASGSGLTPPPMQPAHCLGVRRHRGSKGYRFLINALHNLVDRATAFIVARHYGH